MFQAHSLDQACILIENLECDGLEHSKAAETHEYLIEASAFAAMKSCKRGDVSSSSEEYLRWEDAGTMH